MRLTHVENALNDAFLLNYDKNTDKLKVEFKNDNILSDITSALLVGAPDQVTDENIEEVKEIIFKNLHAEHNKYLMDEIVNLGTGLASVVSKAMEKIRVDIRASVNKYVDVVSEGYKNKLINDGKDQLLNEEVEPSTKHLQVIGWSSIDQDKPLFDSMLSSVFKKFNIVNNTVNATSVSIMASKMFKEISGFEDISSSLNVIRENVTMFGKNNKVDVQAELNACVDLVSSEVNVKVMMNKLQRWMTSGFTDINMNKECIPMTMKFIKDVDLFINMSSVLCGNISEKDKQAFLTNVDKLQTLQYILVLTMSYVKNIKFKNIAVISGVLINDDEIKALQEKHGEKYLVNVIKFQRFKGDNYVKPITTSELVSSILETNIQHHQKVMDGEAKLIKRRALEFVFMTSVKNNIDLFATMAETEATPAFKEKVLMEADKALPKLSGNIDKLHQVTYDMMMNIQTDKNVKGIYDRLTSKYDEINRSAEGSVDDLVWKTEEVSVITDIVSEYLGSIVTVR